ncbi:hypothetical protein M011DRAFT_471912 [Sporormia fimetaria CBS 119925]|uniref:Nucleoporin NSP1 n=1 Tax=Sporormia fimetaria CBS 119925 TaxID=1340428 RepID=A0A6A6UZH7_9PLEO|nr:hypothetical protein M011DRAFT_471912 [Sporormia fimetaria CBS 119925]
MAFNFGGSGTGSNTPKQPLFGATSGAASTTPAAKPLFGATNNTGTSTLFGGGASTTPASGNIFGSNQASTGAPPASSGNTFSFGTPKPGDGESTQKPSLFGGASATGPSSASPFAGFNQTSAATPSSNKTFTLNSTTPAGPPPGTSIFSGQTKPQESSNQQTGSGLFAPKPSSTSSTSSPSLFGAAGAKPSGSTGGFSFGNMDASKGEGAAKQATPTATGSLFGGAAASGSGTQTSSLFGGSTTPAATPASKPAFSLGTAPATTQSSSTTQPSTSLFSKPQSTSGTQSTPASSAAPTGSAFSLGSGSGTTVSTGGFSFGKPAATGPSSAAPSGAATTTAGSQSATAGPSLFSGAAKPAATSAGTSSGTSAPSLFGGAGTSQPAASSTAATTSTPAPFSLGSKPSTSTATTVQANMSATATAGSASNIGLAASTAGPTPSTQSRLKNKSMDEIITRWASDLSKYQKEFQSQAEKVAKWDASIVENTDKVNKLYSKTFQAERDAAEVERQLRTMEDNQAELDTFLDRYEKEVDNMLKLHGPAAQGRSDSLAGPDQDRERTYKLAEKLQERLNELNKDLTEMIEEINTTSQRLSKTGKPDDPLTKVVRVLNSQLSQLQLIDAGTVQLQDKINKAQKESQRLGSNGWNGLGTDPADDFYRSFRGSRSERFGNA